jgi:membrane complex biogenesis BtpA family protein
MTIAQLLGLPDRVTRAVIGMVHLRALPGSPRWDGDMAGVVRAALDDARALADGGADALMVENHGDVPFTAGRVDAASVAGMAVAVAEIRRQMALPVGVNVLKNDVRSALAVAAATGARFVRVNVHVGAVAADQGIIQSEAHETLRYRRMLGVDVTILADVQAKHGMPLAPVPIEQEARDCYHRGLADGLVVSGTATGEPTPMTDIKRVRGAVPEAPILVGSGASAETVAELFSVADAVIVGTSIKRDGRLSNPVDVERVRRLVAAARGARA